MCEGGLKSKYKIGIKKKKSIGCNAHIFRVTYQYPVKIVDILFCRCLNGIDS